MITPGSRLVGSGRDADIFECGPDLVLRRSRDGRSLAGEARVMEYLHGQGYPVPAIEEISEDGRDLVMERVDGPTMLDAVSKTPWRLRRFGRQLGELHLQLHEIKAPEDFEPAPAGRGDRVLHMDLHPLNVLMSRHGPVVIDWARGVRGDPAVDVGAAWLLMAAAEIPGGSVKAKLLGLGRSLLVNSFLSQFDRVEVESHLHELVAWKAQDANMSSAEIETMRRLAEQVERPA